MVSENEMLEEFSQILRDILLDESIELRMDTKREDVDGWDSFNYVNFIVAVEVRHGIKFKVSDVEAFQDVGDLVRGAQRLMSADS